MAIAGLGASLANREGHETSSKGTEPMEQWIPNIRSASAHGDRPSTKQALQRATSLSLLSLYLTSACHLCRSHHAKSVALPCGPQSRYSLCPEAPHTRP